MSTERPRLALNPFKGPTTASHHSLYVLDFIVLSALYVAMANILVFGAGGVGCMYAFLLEKADASVTAVCRSNYDAVEASGINVRSIKWGKQLAKPRAAQSAKDAQTYGPYDYIIVCSKAFAGTSALIKEAVSSQTAIVLAQNGIGIEDEYAEAFPSNTVISGIVYLPVFLSEPNTVMHTTPLEQFEIGTFPASASPEAKEKVARLSQLFAKAGAKAPVHEDIQRQRWNKLAVNAALNPLCALTLCDDANLIRSSSQALDILKDIMREVRSLALAVGYDVLPEVAIDEHLKRHTDRLITGGKEPSMLGDIRHNRSMEVEAILGNTVRIAESLQVHTPLIRLLYVLAKGRNHAILQSDGWKAIATVD